MISLTKADCPKCPNMARTEEQVDKVFGFRTMENGTVRPQSNCKRCRARIQKRRRKLGLEVNRINH
jgi:hypothetical protein